MTQRATHEMLTAAMKAFKTVSTMESALNAALAAAPEHPAMKMLRKLQWQRDKWDSRWCPICQANSTRGVHYPDCRLAALIKEPAVEVDLAPIRRTPILSDVVGDPSKTVPIELGDHCPQCGLDGVAAGDLVKTIQEYGEAWAQAIRERDEARAERDALLLQNNHLRQITKDAGPFDEWDLGAALRAARVLGMGGDGG